MAKEGDRVNILAEVVLKIEVDQVAHLGVRLSQGTYLLVREDEVQSSGEGLPTEVTST